VVTFPPIQSSHRFAVLRGLLLSIESSLTPQKETPSYCAVHIWCNFSSVRTEAATMGGHGLRILLLISFVFLTSSFNLNSNYSRALHKQTKAKSFGYSISFHQENGKTWWHLVFFSGFFEERHWRYLKNHAQVACWSSIVGYRLQMWPCWRHYLLKAQYSR
jgi:hypothetical protein